jgi:glutathione peroxidase
MTIFDVDIAALAGGSAELDCYGGQAALVVNVAAR